jgi:uncharacterized phage-associated protein
MSVSAHDVADELRRRFRYPIGRAKLHKLLYYAQGWHLVWIGRPLFVEPIEAWANGPVVADLWHDEKRERKPPPSQELAGDEVATVDYVVERYGRFTGKELVRRTHEEDPWRDASETDADGWGVANAEITHDALRRWFAGDDELVARAHQVDRLRESKLYSFAPLEATDEIMAAIDRAERGERVLHSRPA